MRSLTIRTRLTIVIVVVTGAICALGVLFGVRVLEDQVREAAIDERARSLTEFAGLNELTLDGDPFSGGFAVEAEVIDVVEDPLVTGDTDSIALEVDGPVFEVVGDEQVQLMEFATSILRTLPDFEQAVEEIGSNEGEILVWAGFNSVFAISATDQRIVDDDEEIRAATLVPIVDLFDFDLFPNSNNFDGAFFDTPEPEELEFEYGIRRIDEIELAFIAEVSDELDALEAIRSTLRNVVIALTALAGLATWSIAGRALRPVGAITDEVREISSGTLSERVPEPKGSDEIAVLARTMNTMLGRLETSDLRRRQFVSDASHELRTPVAVLSSEAEVAKRAPESTTIEDFATVVLGESKRLEGLVEDLLSLARGDEGRALRATTAIDVDEIVLAEAARSRSLPVDRSAVSAGRVVGHKDDMQRVVAHLLDNAARHGTSSIAIGVQTVGANVQLWVDDDGAGVPLDDRERVFERFVRLDDARNRDAGGAGLGLAVARETVELLDGNIQVLDSPLGGARVQVVIPAVAAVD